MTQEDFRNLPGFPLFSAAYCYSLQALRRDVRSLSELERTGLDAGLSDEVIERRVYDARRRVAVTVREIMDSRRHMIQSLVENPCFNAR